MWHRNWPLARGVRLVACALLIALGQTCWADAGAQLVQQPDSLRMECPQLTYSQAGLATELLALRKQAEDRLQALGLTARWEGQWDYAQYQVFSSQADDIRRLRALLAVVLPALESYPAGFFKAIGLRDIGLLKDLVVDGQQKRLAMPVEEANALLYADNDSVRCAAGMELRVHHELYHLLEARVHGSYYYQDGNWIALNRAEFAYGKGGASSYAGAFDNLGHPQPGFVSRYALTAIEEDKAELFGWMMTPAYAARVQSWLEQDAVLAAKAAQLISLLSQLSKDVLNQSYFKNRAQDKRGV